MWNFYLIKDNTLISANHCQAVLISVNHVDVYFFNFVTILKHLFSLYFVSVIIFKIVLYICDNFQKLINNRVLIQF